MPVYTYNCGVTGQLQSFKGKLSGWLRAGKIVEERWAVFQCQKSVKLIPEHELTEETKELLAYIRTDPVSPMEETCFRRIINGRK